MSATTAPGECGSCGMKNNGGKFCGECGSKIAIPLTRKKNKKKKESKKPSGRNSPKASGKKGKGAGHFERKPSGRSGRSPKPVERKVSGRSGRSPKPLDRKVSGRSGKKKSHLSSDKKKERSISPGGKRSPSPGGRKKKSHSPQPGGRKLKVKTVPPTEVMRQKKGNSPQTLESKQNPYGSGSVETTDSSGHFIDTKFPPVIRSLYWKEHSVGDGSDRSALDKYRWLRANNIFHNEEFHVFTGGIEPDDIAQGALGDCYFLSALAAIAEFPKRIMNAFLTKDISPSGKYIMKFCICGEFTEVVVDDNFPCLPDSNKPCFSRANGNELWVMLLEKGWAKINGCYENIIAGHTAEALRAITGAPCETLAHMYEKTGDGHGGLTEEQVDHIWTEIEEGDKADYIMCASAGGDGDGLSDGTADQKFESMGLISSHAYSLIEAHTVDTRNGKVRLLRLRNPWGGTEWKGTWSDNCPNWTPALKKQLDWKDEDDGAFWMDYEDYLPYFENTVICKVDERFSATHLDVGHAPGGHTFVSFELTHNVEKIFLTASQMTKRMSKDEDYKPACAQVILGRMTGKGLDTGDPIEFIHAAYGEAEDITVDVDKLIAGQYIIFVQGDWKERRHCYFNSYNKDDITFEIADDWFDGNFLEYILASACKLKGTMTSYERSNQPKILRCLSLSDTKMGYGCMYYENNSEFCTLQEKVEFTKFKGMSLMPPFSGNGYEVTVPPHSTKVVVLRRDAATAVSQLSIKAKPAFLLPTSDEDVAQMVESKGKKQAVTQGDKTYDIFWYSDNGNFLFVNETTSDECQVVFNFKFEGKDTVTWDFVLPPGERAVKELNAKCAYSYGYRFTVKRLIGSDDELYELIREKGTKGQVGTMQIFYYYYYYGNEYLWLYDNTGAKNFKLGCTFELTNLALKDEPTGASSWTVELTSGATVLRKMTVVEPKPFTFSMSMSVQSF